MSLEDRLAEGRRRVILDLLNDDAGYKLSDEILRVGVAHVGHGNHKVDIIRTELAWLEEQRLVRIEKKPRGDGTEDWFGVLTRDGRVVAEGAKHPGVARAEPR
jgi:hypothetical protein